MTDPVERLLMKDALASVFRRTLRRIKQDGRTVGVEWDDDAAIDAMLRVQAEYRETQKVRHG